MDIETTDGIYAYIGQQLVDACDGPFGHLRLTAMVGDGSVKLSGEIERADGARENLNVHALDFMVMKAVRNLHRLMARDDGDDWNRADFEVAASGEFSIQFGRVDPAAA